MVMMMMMKLLLPAFSGRACAAYDARARDGEAKRVRCCTMPPAVFNHIGVRRLV